MEPGRLVIDGSGWGFGRAAGHGRQIAKDGCGFALCTPQFPDAHKIEMRPRGHPNAKYKYLRFQPWAEEGVALL